MSGYDLFLFDKLSLELPGKFSEFLLDEAKFVELLLILFFELLEQFLQEEFLD